MKQELKYMNRDNKYYQDATMSPLCSILARTVLSADLQFIFYHSQGFLPLYILGFCPEIRLTGSKKTAATL